MARTVSINTYKLLSEWDLLELQLGHSLGGTEQCGGCDKSALHDGQRPSTNYDGVERRILVSKTMAGMLMKERQIKASVC